MVGLMHGWAGGWTQGISNQGNFIQGHFSWVKIRR